VGHEMKKSTVALLVVVLLAGTGWLAHGVTTASAGFTSGPSGARLVDVREAAPVGAEPAPSRRVGVPAQPPATATPAGSDSGPGAAALAGAVRRRPPIQRVLGPGDTGDRVRDLQARLKQLAWYAPDVSGRFDATTRAAVKGFQDKRGIRGNGVVTPATLRLLSSMSTTPSRGEKHNVVGSSASTNARLDPRCMTGRAICIDKDSQTLRWVVDGTVRATMAVRFGASYSPTREGLFHVGWKSENHVSKLYGSSMPFAMFFSGGQAVHYSSDFAARGYAGASHGCVNVRDRAGVEWLFGQVDVGDKVVVYHS
jgi:hypothetical protein